MRPTLIGQYKGEKKRMYERETDLKFTVAKKTYSLLLVLL